ncbi:thiol protease/hemagglutinin PrtT [Hymenobacter sp. M29]|uniref:Thiol protease/hemagglutinin PrtT n=1 Tax=Hymenobacter mellowenesis TaxID=3063995 RepID=A0ABT9ABF1_9BACT|nr:thiol protease/hemagglutinin PrtT [Hymenobacter sp. M29]MDO7847183.1 thiol protease/hemagglutinin PrtT [Hymenobacter sp. M29]
MKKTLLLLWALLTLLGRAGAAPVDEATAQRAGRAFLATHTERGLPAAAGLALAYRAELAPAAFAPGAPKPAPAFYVFTLSGAAPGFVLVAGDDQVTPILGYSDQSGFDPARLAPQVAKWLEGYRADIGRVVSNHVPATADIRAAWQELLGGAPAPAGRSASSTAVNPLVATRWNQSPYYNDLCPYDNAGGGRSVTGCVATAMAQVMKFWNYPATGAGFHSYNTTSLGTLSANFGTTTYQWTAMPNAVTAANPAVATLMYHAGVSVDMGYSANSSNAYVISAATNVPHCAEYALKTYFGYRPTMQGILRSAYTDAQWLALMKAEFDASRPVVYAGFGTGGGHCFVADGYDNNNFLHFNWGWGGAYDGYFQINALNPAGLGTGGGSGGYNSNQQAIIGIQPPAGTTPGGGTTTPTATIALNNTVAPSATTLAYGQAFSISTNLINTGTAAFAGDYCAAVFDLNNALVDYVETKTGQNLSAGYTYTGNLSFSTTGLFSVLPGTYRVGVFYRPSGGNWLLVGDRNSYTNLPQITVGNVNAVRLNSAITPTPTTFTQGQAAAVNLNILNAGTTTFTGQYAVGLYNLDGTFVQTINTYTETTGLPAGYTYSAPYLTLSTTAVTAAPGTYLLAVLHKPAGATAFQLTGSGTFQNPVRVTVQAAALAADAFEPNNSAAAAAVLPVTFSGSTAARSTAGSNCHLTSDVDYYAVNLPAGYRYSITARLHDSYNSANGQTYSLDALFSYSTDGGTTWSTTYDDVMPAPIVLPNGGQLMVKVAPYFAGNIGTYLFDMALSRSNVSATAPPALAAQIGLYPNPARDLVNVDLRGFAGTATALRLLSSTGQVAYETNRLSTAAPLALPLRGLAAGLYLVQFETSAGRITRKIAVNP